MGKHIESARNYLKKQNILGIKILELVLYEESDDVELVRVYDDGSDSIVIPEFITRYKEVREDSDIGVFSDTYYKYIDIKSKAEINGWLFTGMSSDSIEVKFNGMKVNSCEGLFSRSLKVREIKLRGLDTSKCISMEKMFSYCVALERIDTDYKLDMSKVESCGWMFNWCIKLSDVSNLIYGVDLSSCTDMSKMFDNCIRLESIDLRGLKFNSKYIDMSKMFAFSGIKDIKIKLVGVLVKLTQMFYGCIELERLDLNELDIDGIGGSGFCGGCNSLVELRVKNIKFTGSMIEFISNDSCRGIDVEMGNESYRLIDDNDKQYIRLRGE